MEVKLESAIKSLFTYLYSKPEDIKIWADHNDVELPERLEVKTGEAYQIFGYLIRYDLDKDSGIWTILNLYKSRRSNDLSRLDLGGKFKNV